MNDQTGSAANPNQQQPSNGQSVAQPAAPQSMNPNPNNQNQGSAPNPVPTVANPVSAPNLNTGSQVSTHPTTSNQQAQVNPQAANPQQAVTQPQQNQPTANQNTASASVPPPPKPVAPPGMANQQTSNQAAKPPEPANNQTPTPAAPTQAKPKKGMSGLVKGLLIIVLFLIFAGVVAAGAYFVYTSFLSQNQDTNNNAGGGVTQPVNLEYWGLWEDETIYREVFDEFEAENPGVTITYTKQTPTDYRIRLIDAIAQGEGPDLFRFHNTWLPMLTEVVSPLPESVMSPVEYQETFYPIIYQDLTSPVTGEIHGIPLMIDGLGLYYNTEMFATAGLRPPRDWDTLREVAEALTIRSGDDIRRGGIALGTTNNVDNFSDILGLMVLQNGGNLANPSSEAAVSAMSYYTLFTDELAVWDETLPPSTFAFANEQVAMIIAPSWRAHEIAAINPELSFEVVAVPQLPDTQITWASYWADGVSNQSQNQELAWELLEYMSQPENLQKLYTRASQVRRFGNPFPRVDMADQLAGDTFAGAYVDQAVNAQSWPIAGRTFDNGLNDRIIKYYEDYLNSNQDDEALETLTSGVVDVLSSFGVSGSN